MVAFSASQPVPALEAVVFENARAGCATACSVYWGRWRVTTEERRRVKMQNLTQLSRRFDTMYARVGRPSIAPEKLLRAQLLQMLYSIRSERLLMEEMDYNLLFRWFVGLNADDEVWDATTFTKNRNRLLQADVAQEFLACVVEQARAKGLTSDEHFTVDGTLLEAWAGAKSF